MQQHNGLFITLEGADGSGKTSAAAVIKKLFEEQGYETVMLTREPGGSVVAEQIREILVNEDRSKEAIDPQVQTFLFLAARLQHLKRVIVPAIRRGAVVISDRYLDSTMVFQGLLNDQTSFIENLTGVKDIKSLRVRPDYTFFFDVSLETSLARSKKRGMNGLDEIHLGAKQDTTELFRKYFTSVINVYRTARVQRIDANESIESVHAQLRLSVKDIVEDVAANDGNRFGFHYRTLDMPM